ncbi:MAG: sulfur carrier protein ThiS [Cytophagales bacterium]|nr:sulfur carrier protein ThiS [Cytophagales bacterium]
MNSTISITLNGEARAEPSGISLASLIAALGHTPQALATAVNQVFVPRTEREQRILIEGDAVFTFQPITGG